MVKAIIFDVDGVLINSIDSSGKFLWSKNVKTDLGLRSEHFSQIFSKNWKDVTKGKMNTKDHLKSVFDQYPELLLTPDNFLSYWLHHDSNVNHEVLELVKTLNVPSYLGTNQDQYRTEHIKTLVGDSINEVFSSYQIGHLKPEPAFYRHIEATLNLPPEDLLLVDDTEANVEGAKMRGWKSYLYKGDPETLKVYLKNMTS